ncbi:MAG: hypothetical protein HZA88_24440 [Verrucomicrobia bacterium]|nr:hypothetical protein [Verrucomicrobiota bacterium]
MIDYRLDDLGWFEFEQLIQTLAKVQLGFGVEAWGGRSDWGRDAYFEGRLCFPTNEETEGPFVFQCKFVENANAAGAKPEKLLVAAVQKEAVKIRENLANRKWKKEPNCYALFTNTPCPAALRDTIRVLLRKALPHAHISIHDGGDICQWLRLNSELVRSFPQLLSLRNLHELLRDAVHSDIIVRSHTAIALAQAHARVFVPTNAYDSARDKLAAYGFVVLEGPPEMGKTTIGRIIALSQIVCGWEAIECRSPTDVLKMYRQDKQQVFVADDFFGRTEYEPMRVSEWQSELAHILPLLGRRHWLILTCRAHLLEMAKANLDIAGQNNRFPKLGEVVVNAGYLKSGEKARILYRHAKAISMGLAAREIVKKQAATIVNHQHFTPERIRRLVEELVPGLALEESLTEDDLRNRVSEALSNPTKQMQVSFRKLPVCHRWMMFALLEADQDRNVFGVGRSRLQSCYDALCPPAVHQPYKCVLDELTEAFIKKSQGFFSEEIDWIHPSCRDLAIEELLEHSGDRQRFLAHCSEIGLALATSLAGGAKGQRRLPLLQTDEDWRCFTARAEQVLQEKTSALVILWNNFQVLKKQETRDTSHRSNLKRLAEIFTKLCPIAGRKLGQIGYGDINSLETFFEICHELDVPSDIDLAEAWADCLEDAKSWTDDARLVIWQDDGVPRSVERFLRVLNKFVPSFLAEPGIHQQLEEIHHAIVERVTAEENTFYDSPKDNDDAAERAECYESLHKHFEKLAAVPVWTGKQQKCLEHCAVHFWAEAESLREDLPSEPESEASGHERPASEDVNINELFCDL